jgi:hypothetical protein
MIKLVVGPDGVKEVEMTHEEVSEWEASRIVVNPWDAHRQKRNRLLAESDWTQLSDAPVNTEAWATYRQALRDLPGTYEPGEPTWPEEPTN